MGGYGGASGRVKEKCYYDTGGHKVTDADAIRVAEKYIKEGKYVAFLKKRNDQLQADLSVEGVHVEVKGIESMNPDTIEGRIIHGFRQIVADNYRYPPETHREGKVVVLSKHDPSISRSDVINAITKAYNSALYKGEVTGKLEVWFGNDIVRIN